ncbi:proteasomal ubiquitin receptor ADRM1 [Trichuris trichiura]|uniref:Proteasomal ubiquitin receptor ADRM1 homolog n=1 Tax=Trichuris trichiura TaxID=36087 RepID=A0A077Z6J0_TRITR|nr:proteasomal ubiquitin receptor ADRM1 [Trichuris trichiura]
MTLFANRRENTTSHLVEFRAGKMTVRGTTVYPDKRKGLVYVHQSHDSLMHFCWKDRGTGTVEDDLILFPEEVEFVFVPQCTTGRVYLLKFKNSSRKYFFWMQEPKTDKDEEYCRKVNDLLNRPPSTVSNNGRKGNGRSGSAVQESFAEQLGIMNQLLNLGSRRSSGSSSEWHNGSLPSMNQNQLMELLDLMGNGGQVLEVRDPDHFLSALSSARAREVNAIRSSSAADASQTDASSPEAPTAEIEAFGTNAPAGEDKGGGKIALSDLRSVLASLSARMHEGQNQAVRVNLADVFVPTRLENIVKKPENLNRLCTYLPDEPGLTNEERVMEHLRCPHFQQALKIFSEALQSGMLGTLLQQFSFPPPVIEACANGDILAIALCIERAVSLEQREALSASIAQGSSKNAEQNGGSQTSKSLEPAKKKEKRDMDSDMELD